MSDKKFIVYNGPRLNKGDIVDLNNDGVPYVYEGITGRTNTWPLCADNAQNLTRYESCEDFLKGTNQHNKIKHHDFAVKDYSTEPVPVEGYSKIYINPFEELVEGDVICINGRKFINTGNSGLATHLLSAMPAKCQVSGINFDLTGGSTAEPITTPEESSGVVNGGGYDNTSTSNSMWDDSNTWNDSNTWQDE